MSPNLSHRIEPIHGCHRCRWFKAPYYHRWSPGCPDRTVMSVPSPSPPQPGCWSSIWNRSSNQKINWISLYTWYYDTQPNCSTISYVCLNSAYRYIIFVCTVYIYRHIYIYTHTYIYIYTYIYICTYTYMYIYILYIHTYTCICTYVYIYICYVSICVT